MKDYTQIILDEYTKAVNEATEKVRCTRTMAIERALFNVKDALVLARDYELSVAFMGAENGFTWTKAYCLSPNQFYKMTEQILPNLPLGEIRRIGYHKDPISIIWDLLDNKDIDLVEEITKK